MPELPEVETTKRGICPHITNQIIHAVEVRNSSFKIPVSSNLSQLCQNKTIIQVIRRAKYLIIQLSQGWILIHLGMSGRLRLEPQNAPIFKHDHISMHLSNHKTLIFSDPRRFGLFLYMDVNPYEHKFLAPLGPEPLSNDFHGNYLFTKINNRNKAIKSLIMDNYIVVGVGNIYATESLFFSRIHPDTPGKAISLDSCHLLVTHIKSILQQAIQLGGTTLRDFYNYDGKPGYFTMALKVYGRNKLPCMECNTIITTRIIGGRASAFCPQCQLDTCSK